MKVAICLFGLLLFTSTLFPQVGINTTSPEGVLDVESTTQGILIPRVSLVRSTQEAPVVNPNGGALETSTMVYNTATVNDVFPGFYYWDGSRWERMSTNPNYVRFTSVTLPSPSGTNDNTDFQLGTTNYNANIFRIVQSGADLGGIAGGTHGRVIYIYNGDSSDDLKLLADNNSSSTPANRFSSSGDIILKPGNALVLIYDGLYLNRWVVARSDN